MALLRDNARLPLTLISRTTRIPVSTIFDTLRELNGNVIRKYTTIVDFKQLGYEVRLHMFFKLAPEEREIFQDFLEQSSHINTAHRISNGFDFFAEAVFKDMQEYHTFLEAIERFAIKDRKEHFVLDELKREDFMTQRHLLAAT